VILFSQVESGSETGADHFDFDKNLYNFFLYFNVVQYNNMLIYSKLYLLNISVAELHYYDADTDPASHFDGDPDPACHFDADPDLTFDFDADPDLSFQIKAQN
jgi:hypothetical protein